MSQVKRTFVSILKLVVIFLILNWITKYLDLTTESIMTQDFIKDEQTDRQIIPFSGLMCLQKGFIWLMAYLGLSLINYKKNGMTNLDQNGHKQTSNQRENSTKIDNIPAKYQLAIGISAFLSTHFFSQIQDQIHIREITKYKFEALFYTIIAIHLFFINKPSVIRIAFSNIFLKLVYIIVKLYLFYHFIQSLQEILLVTQLQRFFYEELLFYRVPFRSNYCFKNTASLVIGLIFEGVYYLALCRMKQKNQKMCTLETLMAISKFTAITFAVYGLVNGELWQTINYLFIYPECFSTILKYCLIQLIIYFLLAECLTSYSPSVLIMATLSRNLLKSISVTLKQNNNTYSIEQKYCIQILLVMLIEVVLYENFKEKEGFNQFNKLEEQRELQMMSRSDIIETTDLDEQKEQSNQLPGNP